MNWKNERLNHLPRPVSIILEREREREETKGSIPEESLDDAVLVAPGWFHVFTHACRLCLQNLTLFLCLCVETVERNVGERLVQQAWVLIFHRCYGKDVEEVAKLEGGGILRRRRKDRKTTNRRVRWRLRRQWPAMGVLAVMVRMMW